MQVEVHLSSLFAGALIGAGMSLLGALVIGPAMHTPAIPADNTILMAGIERCRDKQPLYVNRVGEITTVKCNGHREDRGQ
jgi:hypothetical protein